MSTQAGPRAFPTTIPELRTMFFERLLNSDAIDDARLTSILAKLERGEKPSADEVTAMRRVTTLDTVCDCDTDHRLPPAGGDGPDFPYSAV